MLEGGNAANLDAFIADMEAAFDTLYAEELQTMDGVITIVDPMITIEEVPSCCGLPAEMTAAMLLGLSDEIQKYESLCAWVERETIRACNEQT